MSNAKRIQFVSNIIHAPAAVVWQHITSIESYKVWTMPFTEGSYFEGSWETGATIRFLSPGGNGMVAEIAESRKPEFISIRHLGFIANGIDDTTSDAVRSWAPGYENYTLVPIVEDGGGTKIVVDMDVTPDFEDMLNQTWPKALTLLKELSESNSQSAAE
jgi:uncharacterized protein YndB with AHSA1/START domain